MFGFIKQTFAKLAEYRDHPWRQVVVNRRVYRWRVLPNHWTRFRHFSAADRVLQIQSDDKQFDIQLGITTFANNGNLGPLVIVGNNFPATEELPSYRRVRYPGPSFVPYNMIHDRLVQAIVQFCFNARRKFNKLQRVDENGLPELNLSQLQLLGGHLGHREIESVEGTHVN